MTLFVAPEIFETFPGMQIVAVFARGLDNAKQYPVLRDQWARAWSEAASVPDIANSQSHPRVRPWREAFRPLGISGKKFPSSIEALLRRALKGGAPVSINPLVDLYNTISLKHVVPAGGFDLEDVSLPIELRLTREGDTFRALDQEGDLAVPAGEVAYVYGSTVLTRHFVWRQAQQGLITVETGTVLLVSEVLREIPGEVVEAVQQDLVDGLRDIFGVECTAVRLTNANLRATW